MKKKIWIAVSDDDLEIPVALADSSQELGHYLGTSGNRVKKAKCYNEKIRFGRERVFIRAVDDDERKPPVPYSERKEYYRERYRKLKQLKDLEG